VATQDVLYWCSGGRCCDRSGELFDLGLVFQSFTILLRELGSEVLKKLVFYIGEEP